MTEGQLFIVSGPSGSGKDTLLCLLFKTHKEIALSISNVTRPMRVREIEGEKYNFIPKERFMNMLDEGKFLEYNEYIGNYYGTPREPVEKCIAGGGDIILEIDVNGAANVRKLMPEAISVFIMPPSFSVLKQRLCGRGTEDLKTVDGRLRESIAEIKRAEEYGYIVVNGDLDEAVANLSSIIIGERSRIKRKKYLIDEVLEDVKSCNW